MNNKWCTKTDYYVENAVDLISEGIILTLQNVNKKHDGINIICIGIDKVAGDSYGPFVGDMLTTLKLPKNTTVYGTSLNLVHAKSLVGVLNSIDLKNKLNIAVDAVIDIDKGFHAGLITTRLGSVYPGSCLDRLLPSVGEIAILGDINTTNSLEPVMAIHKAINIKVVKNMAEVTAKALSKALNKYYGAGD